MKKSNKDFAEGEIGKNSGEFRDNSSSIEGNQQFDRDKETPGRSEKTNKHPGENLKILYIALFIWGFTIGFYFVLYTGITKIAGDVGDKINIAAENSYDVYKPGIEILARLKNNRHLKYIQRLYVHPKEDNRIMIMIKPNYWGTISQEEKDSLKSEVYKNWEKIYKNSNEEEPLKPEVGFANS